MNELRMYVEHLFEGRVLTAEAIELKEEIYGNLVARYDDYRAQGMGESDALTKTMASVTGINELLDGLDENNAKNSAGENAADAADTACANAEDKAAASDVADDKDVAHPDTQDTGGDAAPARSDTSHAGVPTPPEGAPVPGATANLGRAADKNDSADDVDHAPENQPKHQGPRAALIALGAVVVLAAAFAMGIPLLGGASLLGQKYSPAGTTASSNDPSAQDSDAEDESEENFAQSDAQISTIQMQLEDLRLADIQQYLNAGIMGNAANLAELVNRLPGSTLNPSVEEVDAASRTVQLAYRYQEDTVDDEDLDRALVFNATVLMCATDAPDAVRIVVCDDAAGAGAGTQGGNRAQRGDRALDGSGNPNADTETYLFTREMLESPNGWSDALTPERVATQAELDANLRNPVLENDDLVELIAGNARVLQ